MKEVLIANEEGLYYRKLYRDEDEFNLFPRGEYEERRATIEDIKRVSPQLWEEIKKHDDRNRFEKEEKNGKH